MGVFQSVFPVKDYNDTSILEFVSYELDKPKYNVEECHQRDMTYGAPLKVKLRLVVFDVDEETEASVSSSTSNTTRRSFTFNGAPYVISL